MKENREARALRAAQVCKQRGISQSQIAAAIGASQAQVSRVLSGNGLRHSRVFEEVCLFVERFEFGVTADAVRDNEELVEAIRSAWDGSAAHARALATVIRSLAALKPSGGDPRRKDEEALSAAHR